MDTTTRPEEVTMPTVLTIGATVARARGTHKGQRGTVIGFGQMAAAFPEFDCAPEAVSALVVRCEFDGIERTLGTGDLVAVR